VPNEELDPHPDEHAIAAYVDGGLLAEDRAVMDAHLSGCAGCRAEVVDVSRTLRTAVGLSRLLRRLVSLVLG
jgi:anti-sigma factor RsiW